MTKPGRPTFDFSGAVVAITGAASGIGLACARSFAAAGAQVALLDLNLPAATIAAQDLASIGKPGLPLHLDATNEVSVEAAFDAIGAAHGRLDILINNAGIAIRKPSVELPLSDWQKVVDVNLTGVFLCARKAAKMMIGQGQGAIVNISSIMGLSGGGLYPNISYQSSKGGVVNLTRALAVEWARDGIRVNSVAPTWVRTALTQNLLTDATLAARIEELTPLRRMALPEEIADAAMFLAGDGASMITGHVLPVDGGFMAQ